MKRTLQSMPFGLILALSGGVMDAYSYLFRGGVFANAQTGNILLFSVNLAQGNLPAVLRYLLPIAAFSLGVFVSYFLQNRGKKRGTSVWRWGIPLGNAVLLSATAFLPATLDNVACAVISLTCGAQLVTFRKVSGIHVATTMCIGNLQNTVRCLTAYGFTKERSALREAGVYAAIIAAFAVGAVATGLLLPVFGTYTVCIGGVMSLIAAVWAATVKEETV